jgi:uncharacterized coiled-coil protein SlyX
MNAATRQQTITLPRWLWAGIGAFALLLAGTALTSIIGLVANSYDSWADHEQRISRVESSAVTQQEASAMFNAMRVEIRADLQSVRQEIRNLREDLQK